MSSAVELKSYKCKDLAQMAKKRGISGWHSMRKDELVHALTQTSKRSKTAVRSASKVAARSVARKPRPTAAQRRLRSVYKAEGRRKDLSTQRAGASLIDDKMVLMVREVNWLQVNWEIASQSVERARVALAHNWHAAEPVLRLIALPEVGASDSAEQVVRVIPVNGEMKTWFIDVTDSKRRYRAELGYEAGEHFQCIVRSNTVTTPVGEPEATDSAATDVMQDSERIFAMSGGYGAEASGSELREWFEHRLERPLGGPRRSQFGEGAQAILERPNGLQFEVDAEMIVSGRAPQDAFVTISGEPIELNEDGSFTARMNLPDRRQVMPLVATSRNGAAEQTIILAIERNTKVLEPVVREPGE